MIGIGESESQAAPPWHARAFIFWVAMATVLALALRLYNLDVAGFWVDELYTIYVTADVTVTHNSKVFGYLPTWIGMWLSGVNPADIPQSMDSSLWIERGVTHTNARLGSALTGVLTVPLIALAARRMLGTGTAVMLAFLLATAPWHIYWSQASRFYSLQFLFYTLALVFFFNATRHGSRLQFVLAMLSVVLAFLSQPTALAILAVFGADWIIGHARRQPLRIGIFEWAVGTATVALCTAIFLTDYFNAPGDWEQFVAFAGAEYQPFHRLTMGAVYMTGPAVVVAALAAAWMLRGTDQRLTIYLLLAALLPIALFAAWSLGNAVGLRYLLICLFGWLALAAIALDRVAWILYRYRGDILLTFAPLALVVASSAHLMLAYYTNAYGFHPRWPKAYRYIEANAQPGDIIAARHPIVARYYLQRSDVVQLPLDPDELRELANEGARVWLVVEDRGGSDLDMGRWIFDKAELRQSLQIAVPRPVSRVSVLLFEN